MSKALYLCAPAIALFLTSDAYGQGCRVGTVQYGNELCRHIREITARESERFQVDVQVNALDGNFWSCAHISYLFQQRNGLFRGARVNYNAESLKYELERNSEIPVTLFSTRNTALTLRAYVPTSAASGRHLIVFGIGGEFIEVPVPKGQTVISTTILINVSDVCLEESHYLFLFEDLDSRGSMFPYERPRFSGWALFNKDLVENTLQKRRVEYRSRKSDLEQ